MKYPGCRMLFTKQRNNELLANYRRIIDNFDIIDIRIVAIAVVNSPCSRFWVSEERAFTVISDLFKGRPVLEPMNPNKREMYEELFHRVLYYRNLHPDKPLSDIVFMAVNSPAPKFYLQPRTVIEYINQVKKENKKGISVSGMGCGL